MIFTEPLATRIEIPSLAVDYLKTDQAASIAFIPAAKYLVRVSAKKKVLEYEIEVKSNTESHLLFDLKKQKVTLLKEKKLIPEITYKPDDFNDIFTVVEEQPGFVGGEEARIRFLQANIHYPDTAVKSGIQGKVFVCFVVEKDGSLGNVRVLRGIGGGCDEEAVRVVKMMPRWIPGRQRGVAVRVQFNLPIKFILTK
jgi:TonB family protein